MKNFARARSLSLCDFKFDLKMKLTTLLLIVSLFQIQANTTYGQKTKITLNMQNTTVEKVIDEIENLTKYKFFFNEKDVDLNRVVTVKVTKKNLGTVLETVFKNNGIGFKVVNKQIVLSKAPNNAAVQRKITGKIIDIYDVPMLGVNVRIFGQVTGGTSTDFDGNYSINAKTNDILIFTSVGYKGQRIIINPNQTVLNVTMEENVTELEGVVFTGYQKLPKERATGAFVTVTEKEIKRQVTTNIVDRLEGISTGLLTTTTNEGFGDEEVRLTMRGTGTFEADDQPLVVVDGFPIEGSFNTINPNDVANITFLKDAAAASIWGVRAGNGVVVITTKRGKAGKPQVEYSSFFSFEQRPNLDNLLIANSSLQIDELGYRIENGMDSTYESALNGGTSDLNALQQAYFDLNQGNISQGQFNSRITSLRNTDSFNQVRDMLMRDASKIQHNLSFRGGGETNRYYASFSMNEDQRQLVGDENQRVNINLKNDLDISKKLKLDIGMNATFVKNKRNSEGIGLIAGTAGGGQILDRFQNLVDGNGNRLDIPRDYSTAIKDQYEALGFLDWSYNPLTELEHNDFTTKQTTLRLQAGLTWELAKDLDWRFSGVYENGKTSNRNHESIDTYRSRNDINRFTLEDNGNLTYQVPLGGILRNEELDFRTYTVRTTLDYNREFADKHYVSVLGGIEARQIENDGRSGILLGYNDDLQLYSHQTNWDLLDNNLQLFTGQNWPGGFTDWGYVRTSKDRFISSFANGSYTFDNRYTVSGSAKIEQASVFGLDAKLRANKLWSAGASWNIGNEDFMGSGLFDNLILRGSYGVNGNIKRGLTTETTLEGRTSSAYQINFLRFDSVGNPAFTHEDNFVTNIGLDFGMFNSRVSGSIDYYQRKSERLLTSFPVSTTYGIFSQFFNGGEIENKGVEVMLSADVIRAKDFNWHAKLNFTNNKGKVLKYDDRAITAQNVLGNSYNEGEAPGAIFAYSWAGLSADGVPQIYDENGDVQTWEVDVESKDAVSVKGNRIAPTFGSLFNDFSYKGFSLGIFLTYKFGHDFIAPSYKFGQSSGAQQDFTGINESIDRRWQNAGDENNTDIARFPTLAEFNNSNYGNWGRYYQDSDAVIEDASFIRIRDISLSYDLSQKVLERLPIKRLRLSGQVRNVGLLWKATDLNIDPDVIPQTGGRSGANTSGPLTYSRPGIRPAPVFSLGLNINF